MTSDTAGVAGSAPEAAGDGVLLKARELVKAVMGELRTAVAEPTINL
jgi:hypothetical protein